MSYELGIYVSLIIEVSSGIFVAFQSKSGYRASNFRQIGFRLSWNNLSPTPLTPFYKKNYYWLRPLKLLFSLVLIGLFSLLSWGLVAFKVFTLLHTYSEKISAPEFVKEFNWFLSSSFLTSKQVIIAIAKLNNWDDFETAEYVENVINPQLNKLNEKEVDLSYFYRKANKDCANF